jgi:hypothetical protein
VATLAALLALAACSPGTARCVALDLAPAAQRQLEAALAAIDFEPRPPCGSSQAMTVTTVTVDTPDGAPRVTFTVDARGTLFLLSQSRSIRQTTEMTLGASRITWDVEGTRVRGFEAPAGAFPPIVYVYWEARDLVYEFQGNPSGRYSSGTVRNLARGNVVWSMEGTEPPPLTPRPPREGSIP